jgi:hypothetical protein
MKKKMYEPPTAQVVRVVLDASLAGSQGDALAPIRENDIEVEDFINGGDILNMGSDNHLPMW